MAYRNPVALEPRGDCRRWLPDSQQAGRYAWPQCATLARSFARRAGTLPPPPVPGTANPPHKDELHV